MFLRVTVVVGVLLLAVVAILGALRAVHDREVTRLWGELRQPAGKGKFDPQSLATLPEPPQRSRDAGMLKPDPRIFGLLLERARVAPQRVVHVGDDVVADVEGARRAGVTPVWLNRAGAAWPDAATPPPLTVRTLAEIADLLG